MPSWKVTATPPAVSLMSETPRQKASAAATNWRDYADSPKPSSIASSTDGNSLPSRCAGDAVVPDIDDGLFGFDAIKVNSLAALAIPRFRRTIIQ
jgi:hypothetical protein